MMLILLFFISLHAYGAREMLPSERQFLYRMQKLNPEYKHPGDDASVAITGDEFFTINDYWTASITIVSTYKNSILAIISEKNHLVCSLPELILIAQKLKKIFKEVYDKHYLSDLEQKRLATPEDEAFYLDAAINDRAKQKDEPVFLNIARILEDFHELERYHDVALNDVRSQFNEDGLFSFKAGPIARCTKSVYTHLFTALTFLCEENTNSSMAEYCAYLKSKQHLKDNDFDKVLAKYEDVLKVEKDK